jgi:predicted Zn-dependent peptidase
MSRIANSYIYTGKVLTADNVEERLEKISLEEINNYAKELFSPDAFSQIEIVNND